jgi:NAD(P)-dependent dehydrogenase (short-subunit alcohol dehydrogenase family)
MNDKTKLAIAATGVAAGLVARTFYQRSHEREIAGSVVLITGGGAEFALGLARRFVREDCRVALCSAEEVTGSMGAHITTFPCNVANPIEADRLIDEVTRHFGRIDVMVNSVSPENLAPGESEASVIYPTLALLPQLIKRNSGKVVNITSSVSKAAAGFSEGLGADLAPTGVSVSTLDSRLTPSARQVVAAVKRIEAPKTSPVSLNSANLRTVLMLGRLAARYFGQSTRTA